MIENRLNKYLFVFPVLLLIVLHIPFYFIFPPVYGSWQTWAYLGDGTYQSYLDGGVLFPPLYIKYYELINFINKDIWFSVTLGILRTVFIYVLIYLLVIKEGFSRFTASLTSIFFIISFASQDTYLPDDYHSMVKLIYILNLYFFYLVFKNPNFNSQIKNCIYSGVCLVFVFLLKQNIGLMLLIGEIFTLVLFLYRKRIRFSLTLIYLTTIFSLLILMAYFLSFSLSNILEITLKNDSKGSIISLLTNILTLKINHKVAITTGIVAAFLYFILTQNWFEKILKGASNKTINKDYLETIFTVILITLFCVILVKKQEYLLYIGFTVLWYCLYQLLKNKDNILGIFFWPFAFLIFASTLTASINVEDMAIICLPAIIFFSSLIEKNESKKINIIFVFIVLVIGTFSVVKKYNKPWEWYGMSQSQIAFSTYKLPFPELKFISTDFITSEISNSIKNNIDEYSLEKNDVLLYPNLPIYYLLTNKVPPYGVANYWFDTTPDKAVTKLLSNLSSSENLPRLIIFLNPPSFAYEGHSSMRKKLVPQYQFINQLQDLILSGKYKLIDYKIFNNRIYTSTKYDDMVNVYVYPKLFSNNESITSLINKLQKSGVVINTVGSSNSNLARIEVSLRYRDLETAAKSFNWITPVNDNSYTFQIFKLQ